MTLVLILSIYLRANLIVLGAVTLGFFIKHLCLLTDKVLVEVHVLVEEIIVSLQFSGHVSCLLILLIVEVVTA